MKGGCAVRETSYHAVIGEMTVRALWEMQNVMDCIPDELWDHCYGGAPLWQHLYHTLHHLDQWFINPRDNDFVEPYAALAGVGYLPGHALVAPGHGRLFLHDKGKTVDLSDFVA